jgi:hypothetical protein
MTWDIIATVSDDQEVFQAFEQGCTPLSEKVETAGSQNMVQLCPMSFHELLACWYGSAVLRHAIAKG